MLKSKLKKISISEIDLEELNMLNNDFKKVFFEGGEEVYKVKGKYKEKESVLNKIVVL